MIVTILAILILGFIVFNFYTDYSNWSNTGSFLEGMSNPSLTLKSLINKGGTPPGSGARLGKCEGDCDTDADCIGNLKCFQRSSSNDVPPGCKAGGSGDQATTDYCFDPNDAWPIWPNEKELVNKGGNPPGSGKRLGECEGDCDNDNDCIGDLKCFQRSGSIKVPGCKYSAKNTNMPGSHDFCYDPKKMNPPPNYDEDIKKAYREILGREPDPGGFNHYKKLLQNGTTVAQMRSFLENSEEAKNRRNSSTQQSINPTIGVAQSVQATMHSNMIPQQQMGQQSSGISAGSVSQQQGPVGQASAVISNTSFSNPKNFTLFNEQILQRVLANKNLIPEDIPLNAENPSSLIRIGKSFMLDVAKIRNLVLPNIKQNDYEILGRIVSKHLKDKEDGANSTHLDVTKSRIMNTVQALLSSTELNSSIVHNGTIPSISTSNRTTGLMSDKTNAYMTGKGNYDFAKGMNGMSGKYTDSYKPTNDTINPKPYDSVWSVFY